MAFKRIDDQMKSPEGLRRVLLHGSTTTDGQAITAPNPPGPPRIGDRSQAISISLLLRRAQPRKAVAWTLELRDEAEKVLAAWPADQAPPKYQTADDFPGARRVTVREEKIEYPSLSDEEIALVQYHTRPAHVDVIQAHLLRLAGHKHLTGDATQKAFRLAEDTERLAGATELQVFRAVEHFIENDEGEWFPPLAKLKRAVFELTDDSALSVRQGSMFD